MLESGCLVSLLGIFGLKKKLFKETKAIYKTTSSSKKEITFRDTTQVRTIKGYYF